MMLLQHCQQGLPRKASSSSKLHRQPAASAYNSTSIYTPQDFSTQSTTFRPPVVDISNIIAGGTPTAHQIQQVHQECAATGFLAILGHGIETKQLQQLFDAAERLFDLPLEAKLQLSVENMQRGRGYEISPEHKQYMEVFQQLQQQQPLLLQERLSSCREVSAAAGILSERFICGPPLTPQQLQDPYYSSELGQVFFTPDNWPNDLVPDLQPAMQRCYVLCETTANAVLCLFATALGMPGDFFVVKVSRHHSNLQVANYPSHVLPPGPDHLRKKAHVDSGTLTLLASQDWLPGSTWQAGDGGLQLMNAQGSWLEVEVPPGALLLNLGSLMTRWTNGIWKSTLHRVTNPPAWKAHNSRRLSMAFFHKPDYTACIEVLPTCYGASQQQQQQQQQPDQSAAAAGFASALEQQQQPLPSEALFLPVKVGDITRQGILHKYRHLPPEEASKKYHEALSAVRSAGPA